MRTVKKAIICAAVCAVSLVTLPPAQANWFAATGAGGGGSGTCAGGNITDDKSVDFFNVDPSSELADGSAHSRSLLAAAGTGLTISYASGQTTAVDVLLGDAYYDSFCEAYFGVQWTTDGVYGLRGMTSCDYLSGNRCGQAVVRISNRYFDAHGQQGDRWIVCHEVGHAIGLRHRSTEAGCMKNDADVSQPSYTTHDKNHFAANWVNEPASGNE